MLAWDSPSGCCERSGAALSANERGQKPAHLLLDQPDTLVGLEIGNNGVFGRGLGRSFSVSASFSLSRFNSLRCSSRIQRL